MIISKELAQKIVDHLMDIVQRNVNIMDCNGVIIASGSQERINTFHQGGWLAVTEQHVVEIHPEEVSLYTGALPGVMWPIDLKEKIVGVVGVTGEPHEVRNTAKLVKTVTELILEREMVLADYGSENRMKEQLVTLLFSDNQDRVMEDIYTLAGMLNYKLNLPRLIIVVKLEPKMNENYAANGLKNLFSDRLRENVSRVLKEATFFTDQDMSLFYKKNLCIFKSVPDDFNAQKINTYTTSIMNLLNSIQPRLKFRIGIGSQVLHDSQLHQSYCEALYALEYSNSNIVCSINEFDVLLSYLFDKQCKNYSSCLALNELKRNFDEMNRKYDMKKTLECLLANNLNVSMTASQLFIHRNTLKFRLEKLKMIMGLDPCHFFQHAMLCKFILSIDEKE